MNECIQGISSLLKAIAQGSANYSLRAQSSLLPIFVNKDLVDATTFLYCFWLLSCITVELCCNRDHAAHRALNIYYLALLEKVF